MSNHLSAKDLFDLSQAFHDLSVALGNYRYAQWDNLTPSQRTDLEAKQWTLFNASSDLNAKSVLLKMKLLDDDLQTLKSCTTAMKEAAENISEIKHAIAIATKAVAFGGTIYLAASTGDVGALVAAASALEEEIQA